MAEQSMIERVALRMFEVLDSQPPKSNYVVGDAADLKDVLLDGHFDLEALARAAIEDLEKAGFVIVPRQPTAEMLLAGHRGRMEESTGMIWDAMIDAAPKSATR